MSILTMTRSGKEERGWSSGAVEGAVEGEL